MKASKIKLVSTKEWNMIRPLEEIGTGFLDIKELKIYHHNLS